MNKLGVHALVWVGGWSGAEAGTAIRDTAGLLAAGHAVSPPR